MHWYKMCLLLVLAVAGVQADVRHCTACDCDCSWATNSSCGGPGDGSCCWNCCCAPPTPAPPTPPPTPAPARTAAFAMIKRMGLGINMGNTLEAPTEGAWAPAAKQSYFVEYRQKGFTNVRVPVHWDTHTSQSPPYTVNASFMDRVEEVVGWSIGEGLVTTINTHHEGWLDNQTTFEAGLPRMLSIWTQIAARFANYSDTLLCFEVFNEPHIMNIDQLNQLYAGVLPIIRKTNPTRITFLGGLSWYSPGWITGNPDALFIDPTDEYLALQVHNYDPYGYAWKVPGINIPYWGSPAQIKTMNDWMDDLTSWSVSRGVPIYYSEFGVTHDQNKTTGRDTWYLEHRKGIESHGWAAAVWDDDGGYRVFDRVADTWDVEVLVALGKNASKA